MKQVNMISKLQLNKKTIAKLNLTNLPSSLKMESHTDPDSPKCMN